MAMNSETGDVMVDMNTTPLIDVLLVLLVLVLITLPIQTHAVKLIMGEGPPLPPATVVDVDVAFDGAISWNGRVIDRGTLDALLTKSAQQSPQPEFHITADRLAHYERVAQVLSDAQRLGVKSLGIVNTNQYLR